MFGLKAANGSTQAFLEQFLGFCRHLGAVLGFLVQFSDFRLRFDVYKDNKPEGPFCRALVALPTRGWDLALHG